MHERAVTGEKTLDSWASRVGDKKKKKGHGPAWSWAELNTKKAFQSKYETKLDPYRYWRSWGTFSDCKLCGGLVARVG